ncbi:MAG: HD domain-containing protein, partial [Bacilli bacterium]|nr:HD domain-containing protein [Bacilli bacterium]
GCYLGLVILFAVCSLCDIKINKWVKLGLLLASTIAYLSALTVGYLDIFYKSITMERINGVNVFTKEYNYMHTFFYVVVIVDFLLSLAAMIYANIKKKQISNRVIRLLYFPAVVSVLAFFGGRRIIKNLELLPLAYVFAQVIYLFIIYRLRLYDITDSAIDSLVNKGDTGFASFDFKYRYLGSNQTAKDIFYSLNQMPVDKPLDNNNVFDQNVLNWLEDFKNDEGKSVVYYSVNDHIYEVQITYLYDGKRKRGYQLFITDDTKNQQYIKLINSFNEELTKEVEIKTANLVKMHNKFILGMATMVESRDNSTGGHIKRTSEGVRILLDEMRTDPNNNIDDKFYFNMIKAAPMHDLGKIAVDDVVLRKPGKFTPEEFEIMKTHSEKGVGIIRQILADTDDDYFKGIAENVAHYHHERWDGSGYPHHLVANEIPIEARIMAVADVYDALVSKRVYKDSMSFSEADKIMMESFGKHFDPDLQKYYVAARPKLEEYYMKEDKQNL